MTLEEAEIGREVYYMDYKGENIEWGVITSKNTRFVFVKFKNQANSQACKAKDLNY